MPLAAAHLAPVLLKLKEQFCKIPLRAIFQLRGSYAIRWLEMILSQQHVGSWEMTVAELRDWLNVADHDLVKTGHLVSRAIEYPRKELDATSHLSFDFEPHRQGKSIIGWTFTVRQNKPKPKPKKSSVLPIEPIIDRSTRPDGFRFDELRRRLRGATADALIASKLVPVEKKKPTKIEPTEDEVAAHMQRKAVLYAQLDLLASSKDGKGNASDSTRELSRTKGRSPS